MSLRGLRAALREKRLAPERLPALLRQAPLEPPAALIEASLCVHELSKGSYSVSRPLWDEISRDCVPLMSRVPVQNLTLLINALSARAPTATWLPSSLRALQAAPVGAFSAQDLCLTFAALARLSFAEVPGPLLARLLAEELPRCLAEVQPRGLAALAHGLSQLPPPHQADARWALEALAPRLASCRDLRPAELALALDALSRVPELGAESGAMRKLEESLCGALEALKPLELVMALCALARAQSTPHPPLAEALPGAVQRSFQCLPQAELCIVVHSMAKLDLQMDLLPAMLAHFSRQSSAGEVSLDHWALLLHGLAKCRLRSTQLWAQLPSTRFPAPPVPLRTAVRLSLAAAKSDVKLPELRRLMEVAAEQPEDLEDEALAALVYTLAHPFYADRRLLLRLLQLASPRVFAQSMALQMRVALLALFQEGGVATLRAARILQGAEAATRARADWQLPLRPSAMQSDVHVVSSQKRTGEIRETLRAYADQPLELKKLFHLHSFIEGVTTFVCKVDTSLLKRGHVARFLLGL
ncbi:unnamed protein product [Effrenium voratum]|nr:unnamed protein product [Effrenium voratum]